MNNIIEDIDFEAMFKKYGWEVTQEKIEEVIEALSSPGHAYSYARDVIKGRWPEAEPYIRKDSIVAYLYAMFVIKDRWQEAEPHIKQDRHWWREYKCDFGLEDE